MSVMRRVSTRNLLAHKVRLLLTLLSVVLGTAFVAGSFIFTDTLKHSFTSIFGDAYKGISTHVEPKHDFAAGVPFALADTFAKVDGVRAVQPNVTQPIALVGPDNKKVDTGGAPSEASMWVDPRESITKPPTFASGRAPEQAGEVVINSGAADKNDLAVGDQVKIVLPNVSAVPLKIVGIYDTDAQTGGYVGALLSRDQALSLLTDGKNYTSVDLAADSGVSQQTLTDRVAKVLPSDLEAETGDKLRDDTNDSILSALSFINYVLLAFGFIALIVGTFIIYNTFSMIVAQRLRELALLRAVGASRRQVRRSVLFEAAITGAIGSVLGIAGGIGLAYGLHALLDALNVGLPSGSLVLSVRTIVVAVVIGIGVTMLSAYAPARRASSIPPVAAMREEFAAPTATSTRRRSLIGLGLLVVGAVVTTFGAIAKSTGAGASLMGLGLVLTGSGAFMLAPLLSRVIIDPLGRVIGKPFGRVGTLARTNAVRNPRRTAATAFALTLGLLIVSGIAVLGASIKASVDKKFDTSVTADYILTTSVQVQLPQPAAAAAAKVPGVESLTELHPLAGFIGGHSSLGTAIDGPLPGVLKVTYKEGSGQPTGTSMLAAQSTVDKYDWKVGGTYPFSIPGYGSRTVTLTGVYEDDELLGPWLLSGEVYRALVPPQVWGDEVALVKAAPGTDLDTLRAGLEQATNPYYIVNVDNRTEFKGQIAAQINGLIGLLYGLLGLAIIIAILGIINTLALSVVERRREIGMLRAVGMVRKQVRRIIYLESLLIAVFGAVLGLVMGLVYGSLFTKLLHSQGLDVLQIPWGQAVGFLILAAIVGVLAALWPGIRAARTPPLAAIVE